MGATLLVCGSAIAEAVEPLASEFRINHADPEGSVPSSEKRNAKPIEFGYFLQDLVTFAETAARSGDHRSEARYYSALAKAVPDRSVGFAKLCQSLEAAGERDKAISACRDALGRPGAEIKDYVRFVRLVLGKPGDLPARELEDVKEAALHLQKVSETRVAGAHLQCEIGARIESVPLLEACTGALVKIAPEDPKTISFLWALAVRRGDRQEAGRLIGKAKAAGLGSDAIMKMERATALHVSPWRRWIFDWRAMLAAAALVATALVAFVLIRRRRSSSKVALEIQRSTT